MTPDQWFEFIEHLLLFVALAVILLYIAHVLVVFSMARLKNKYRSTEPSSVAKDAALAFKLAASVNADAQCVYDNLIGGGK